MSRDQRQEQQNAPGNSGASARHRQQQQVAVRGLLIERPESSNNRAEKGGYTGVLYSKNQWMCFLLEKAKVADGPAGASGNSNNTRF